MGKVHPTAVRGYTLAAEDYEAARPGYPPEAVALIARRLCISAGTLALELGAGTGKFTRLLAAAAPGPPRIVASDPVAAMLGRLAARVRGAAVVAAAAEAIPLPPASLDAVVAATSFHWFRGTRALAEIHRVLRPGGGLGLVWNNPDLQRGWVAEVWGLVGRHRGDAPANRDLRWREAFEDSALFTPLRHRTFTHAQEVTVDRLLQRLSSISFVAALPEEERQALFRRVREIFSSRPEIGGRGNFRLPYRTDVYWCRRQGDE